LLQTLSTLKIITETQLLPGQNACSSRKIVAGCGYDPDDIVRPTYRAVKPRPRM